ncbi:fibronectin type III domain-containing protein, partial [Pontimonas sp.]|nr:fibronectin type III domain-containing protein [Pontimonas sp.]
MKNPLKIWLGSLLVTVLALVPSLMPVAASVAPGFAATVSESGGSLCIQTVSNASGVDVRVLTVDGQDYCLLEFTASGSTTWTVPSGVSAIQYLVVGGGASGSRGRCGVYWGGGGGGGGVATGTTSVSGSVSVSVGAGGSGSASGTCDATNAGNDGDSSTLGGANATGGDAAGWNSKVGGSSGSPSSAGPSASNSGGTGTANGADCGSGDCGAGGGGGAGGVGGTLSGGTGLLSSITGVAVRYGSGGPGRDNDQSGTTDPGAVDSAKNGLLAGAGGGDAGSGFGSGAVGLVVVRYSLIAAAPTISSVTAGDNELDVSFSTPAHTGGAAVTDYEFSFDGSTWTSFASATDGTKTISGLTNGTAYTPRVRAVTANGSGLAATHGSAVTPRASQTITWAPTNTFVDWDGGSITSLTFDTAASAIGGAAITYSESSSNCSIPDSGLPTVSLSGTGDCVVTATSAAGIYAEATASVTLRVFDGVGSGNTCDQNAQNLSIVTTEIGSDCVVEVRGHTGSSGSWFVPETVTEIKYLVVGGGGAGGSRAGGGGGAGGVLTSDSYAVSARSEFATTIGAGGEGRSDDAGGDGGESVFGALTAEGGGGGGGAEGLDNEKRNGRAGASGGGSAGGVSSDNSVIGSSTGQGNDGGKGRNGTAVPVLSGWPGGGGGGFSAAGETPDTNAGGEGGAGVTSDIKGASACFAAGGGGGIVDGSSAGDGGLC